MTSINNTNTLTPKAAATISSVCVAAIKLEAEQKKILAKLRSDFHTQRLNRVKLKRVRNSCVYGVS